MKNSLIIFAVLGLMFFHGCSSKPESASVEIVDGVEIVHNPAAPQYPDWAVEFEEDLVIQGEDESGGIRFYLPRGIAVDQQGNIYISDYQDQDIKVFDSDGAYLQTIGRKGEGPGEFQALFDFAILSDGRLLAMDFRSRRTSLFSLDGKLQGSHPWRSPHLFLYLFDDSTYVIDEMIYGEETQLSVKKFDFEGNEIMSFGEFVPRGMKMVVQGDSAFSITVPSKPQSIFAGNLMRRHLYHCLNDSYLIEVYDYEGTLIRKIDRPYDPVPFTEEDAQDYFSEFEEGSIYHKMAREVDLPKVKTITDKMTIDDSGNLWVATNEVKNENSITYRAYDIFNAEGIYILRKWSHIPLGRFINGMMYGLDSDEETGNISVKRYRVTWKK
jgi:hypothetical protein